MSPVEPRPVVMGTMGLPSTVGTEGFTFLPSRPAAPDFAGANRLLPAAPSAARNERRFQPSFVLRFMCGTFQLPSRTICLSIRSWCGRIDDHRAADDFNQRVAG